MCKTVLTILPLVLFISTTTYSQTLSSEEVVKRTHALSDSKPDTAQISILLQLAKYHLYKEGENPPDIDSAARFIQQAEEINSFIHSTVASGHILLSRAYLLRERGQLEKAKATCKLAVDMLKTGSDLSLTGDALFEYSRYFEIYDSKPLSERIQLVDSAVACFERSGNVERLGASLHMLGDLMQVHGSDFVALQKLQRALDVYAPIKHAKVHGIYSLMGRIYTRLRDYRKALDYELLAMRTAEEVGDSTILMCMINTDIGQTLSHLGEMNQALSYQHKALEIAKKFNDTIAIFVTACNIAITLNTLQQPRAALDTLDALLKNYAKPSGTSVDYYIARAYMGSYTLLREYEKGEPYCNLLLRDIASGDLNDYSRLYAYAEVVKFYVNSRQYTLATKYLYEHSAIAKRTADLLQISNSERLWFMLDTARQDYRSAVDRYIAYKNLNDSLFNETKSQQISELQVQYETEKKDKDIQLLKRQDLLQKTKIQNGAIIRNVSLGVALLLCIITALIYNRYRLKQRTNRRLAIQQAEIAGKNVSLQQLVKEKEWLLKEIHHRTKNNLQIVISLLHSQSAYTDNESALIAIHDSEHRVHAMSLIHHKLYRSENVCSIDMTAYIRELVFYLSDAFDTGQRIHFDCTIDAVELDVSQAVPLGLILNEAITNSIKYAFPGGACGNIDIMLSKTFEDHCLLTISDNGIGLPPGFANKKFGSLGMSLMAGLVEDLEGTITIDSHHGTSISISFVHEGDTKAINLESE